MSKTNDEILSLLKKEYDGMGCALNYTTPFELLIATILSAQCTDERVNKVTSVLFKEHNTPEKIANLQIDELSNYIRSCGFYSVKAKNIMETSKILLNEYNSEVPNDMEKLVKLPGVGRKTANVVVSNAFNVPAIAVDTHVFRVSKRLGFAKGDNVDKVEKELMKNIPKNMWSETHHYLIWHGRKICKAKKPACNECFLKTLCKNPQN